MLYIQTPLKITTDIKRYCSRVSPGNEPQFLTIEAWLDAVPQECFDNVSRYVAANGGEPRYGWNVFAWPRIFMEFELHCVWVSAGGEYRDITPRSDGERVTLFLDDPRQQYPANPVDNIRIPLSGEESVRDYIALAEERFRIRNRDCSTQGPSPWISPDDQMRLEQIERRMGDTVIQMRWRPHRNDPCTCGSRKKFKQCCGSEW